MRHLTWRLAMMLISTALAACGGADDANSDIPAVDPALYAHAAGQDYSVVSGGTAPLYCLGPAGTTYQWIVSSNGGLPVDLTSYSAQQISFVAPTVKVATPIVLICRMTNGSAPAIDSRITVTVQPVTPPIVINPADYVRAAGLDFNVAGGATAPFFCQGPNGSSYQWVVEANAGLPIELSSYNTQRTSFTAPVVPVATPIVLACRMTTDATAVISSRVSATIYGDGVKWNLLSVHAPPTGGPAGQLPLGLETTRIDLAVSSEKTTGSLKASLQWKE